MDEHGANRSVVESFSSITLMYERAKRGEQEAASELWQAYSKRLMGLARAVLIRRGIASYQASEDSVVNPSFANFFEALSTGKYHEVKDRHDLWRLLSVITRNNALNQAKKFRGGVAKTLQSDSGLQASPDGQPSPEEVAALSDMVDWLEQEIRDRSQSKQQAEKIIRVMKMTLSGYHQREISEAIERSEATVRSNLRMIRSLLSARIEKDTS